MSIIDLPAKPLTLDDLAAVAAADPDHRFELQEGSLLVMPPPDTEHASFLADMIIWLRSQGYGRGQVLATPGLRMASDEDPQAYGRSPDIVVCRAPMRERAVWLDPADVLLAIEVVSPGSETLDRVTKQAEYARSGIPNYWRVERGGGRATVHVLQLGTGADGQPAYVPHHTVLLDDLLDTGSATTLIAAG